MAHLHSVWTRLPPEPLGDRAGAGGLHTPLSHPRDLRPSDGNACRPPRYFRDNQRACPGLERGQRKSGSETVGNRQEDPPDWKII